MIRFLILLSTISGLMGNARAEEKPGLNLGTAVAEASASPQRETGKIPEDWRASLPQPVLGGHPEWVDFWEYRRPDWTVFKAQFEKPVERK